MSRLDTSIGRRRDWPQLESYALAAISAGTGADPAQDLVVCHLPDVTKALAPLALAEGVQGGIPTNQMVGRLFSMTSGGAANTAGNATNNCDYRVNVWRNSAGTASAVLMGCIFYYKMSVATTAPTTITAGSRQTVTPAAMTGIVPGMALHFSGGTGTGETVYVLAVTSTTFDAFFVNAHSGAYNITSILVPNRPVYFVPALAVSTTSATTISAGSQAFTPASMYGIHVNDWLYFSGGTGAAEAVQVTAVTATTATATFANGHSSSYTIVSGNGPQTAANPVLQNTPFTLLPDDVITFTRISNNATGLATPVSLLQLDWVPSKILR